MRALVIGFGLVVSVAAGMTTVHSQGFPNKLIRIIVPFTPGGSNDVVAREIAIGLAGTVQPDGGGREQAGRRRHHRLSVRGEVAAGRVHA